MFSFPNKERRFDWIRNALTRRSSSRVNTNTDLPLYHTTDARNTDERDVNAEHVAAGGRSQRNRLASIESLFLVGDSLLTWQGAAVGDTPSVSVSPTEGREAIETPPQEASEESVPEASGLDTGKIGEGDDVGSENATGKLVMGGVMFGSVVLAGDENRDEREIFWDTLDYDPPEEIPGTSGTTLMIVDGEESNAKTGPFPEVGHMDDDSSGSDKESETDNAKRNEKRKFHGKGESSVAVIGGNVGTIRDEKAGIIRGGAAGVVRGGTSKAVGNVKSQGVVKGTSSKDLAGSSGHGHGKFKKRGGEGGRWEAQQGGGYLESQSFIRTGSKFFGGEKLKKNDKANVRTMVNPAGKKAVGESSEQPNGYNGNLGELAGGVTDKRDEASLENGEVHLMDDHAMCGGEVDDANEAGDGEDENAEGFDEEGYGAGNVAAVGDQEALIARPSVYLRDYHLWMYLLGVTAYTPGDNGQFKNWCDIILYVAQKILYAIILGTSVFRSLCQSKRWILSFLSEDGESRYTDFVRMSYNISFLMISLFAAYLLVIAKEKFEKMLHSMEEYENAYHHDGSQGSKTWKRNLLALLALTTFGIAIGRTLSGAYNRGMEKLVLSSAQEYAEDLYIWSSFNMVNESAKLEPEYSNLLDTRAKIFGGIVIFRDAAFYLLVGLLLDLVIIVGIVLYNYVSSFMKEVREITAKVPRRNVMEWTQLQARREAAWHKYMMLRLVVDDSNDVFDPLLKLMHVGNLLMYCFIMVLIIFFKDEPWFGILLFFIYLIKAEIGYHIDSKIAEVNEVVRDWIRSWGWHTGKIEVDGDEIDVAMILDELDKKPMGLGKGKFLIHQFFHLKFLGIVLSVFFSMADEIKKQAGM